MGEEGGGVPVSVLLGRDYIDYRGSKLTRILQNSLNGNTKTVIICTVPQTSLEETLSTFQSQLARILEEEKALENEEQDKIRIVTEMLEEVLSKDLQIKEQKNKIKALENHISELQKILNNTGAEMKKMKQALSDAVAMRQWLTITNSLNARWK